jgi:hypothetical protein
MTNNAINYFKDAFIIKSNFFLYDYTSFFIDHKVLHFKLITNALMAIISSHFHIVYNSQISDISEAMLQTRYLMMINDYERSFARLAHNGKIT